MEVSVSKLNRCMVCFQALGTLGASKVVVDRYFDGKWEPAKGQSASEVYLSLSGASTDARHLERGQVNLNPFAKAMVVLPFECLANFVRHSKAFRQAMKEASAERTLFDQLGFLVSAGVHRKLSPENSQRIRVAMADVATSLALSADSQLWALDKGVLKLVEAVYAVSPADYRQDSFRRDRAPTFLCNAILLHMLHTETAAEMLRAHNALVDGFRPHRRKINDAAGPKVDLWIYLKGKLQGRRVRIIDPRNGQTCRLDVKATGTGTPVVCSWKGCTAEPEPVGASFKRCAGCHVARYCCKEHQKLHWPTHKIHCRAHRAKQGRHASSPAGGEASSS
ncbi:hypothetical protein KFL_001330160 [Klebsormidium nitens]|uniref:MYND-type domain-containing protein n=1 Tax=Klebsormidium nitens TaxID=105231 RepID=A0A0U9HJM1_KLENI|nr:hypothetical protein KFL_001330160 [Klebsormidium nitens]|eukprot:GAQ83033.1 hypothetical protein KFL_001330160 [Klebsormidium nitens]